MSWHASHIYIQYDPRVLDFLKKHPLFSTGLYLVDNLEGVVWPDKSLEHGLPEGGLIVVRELESPDDHCEEFETTSLNWHDPSLAEYPAPNLILKDVFSSTPEDEYVLAEPPNNLLGCLKGIAQVYGVKVAYYFHETWGGQTETELAWTFTGCEKVFVFSDQDTIAIGHENGVINHATGCVLSFILAELGLVMRSSYFALHTGAFLWTGYRR